MAETTYTDVSKQALQDNAKKTNTTGQIQALEGTQTYSSLLPTQTATIIDDNGEKQTAAVAGNTAVQDVLTTKATTTESNAGLGSEGSTDSTGEAISYWETQKKAYEDMYNQQISYNNQAAADAAARAAELAQQNIDSLNAQWQSTNKQLYRDYMEQQKTTPQKLAAMGYSGGLTESSLLKLGNAYQEALNENEASRIGGITDINTQRAQSDYEAQKAAADANQQALTNKNQYIIALQEQQQQEAQNKAETMASQGDFSGYLNLGYSQDEVDYMTRLWLKQNPGYKSLWVQAHPTDAERLGVKVSTGSGRKYSNYTDDSDIVKKAVEIYTKQGAIAADNYLKSENASASTISKTANTIAANTETILGARRAKGR